MSKKPTGSIGPIKLTNNPIDKEVWDKIIFSKNKDEIEIYFFDLFINKLKQTGVKIEEYEKNTENHFDFTVYFNKNILNYYDLAEIVLNHKNSNPYIDEKNIYEVDNDMYINSVLEIISKKSKKYSSNSTVPIHLLLYVTHWKYITNDYLVKILQKNLYENNFVFNSISIIEPLGLNQSLVSYLYPVNKNVFEDINSNDLNNLKCYRINPQGFKKMK